MRGRQAWALPAPASQVSTPETHWMWWGLAGTLETCSQLCPVSSVCRQKDKETTTKKTVSLTSVPSLEMRKKRLQEDQVLLRDEDSDMACIPAWPPSLPVGKKQASQGSRQASSLAKRYTGSFLSTAHCISCPDFPTWQKWALSQQRLRLQSWREARSQKRQCSWPHWLGQWNSSERKSRPAITKGANLKDKHCNTSSGNIQVQTEPQRRGTAGSCQSLHGPRLVKTKQPKTQFYKFSVWKTKIYTLPHINYRMKWDKKAWLMELGLQCWKTLVQRML